MISFKNFSFKVLPLLALSALSFSTIALAESYDKYTPALREYNRPTLSKKVATRFLAYPFEIIKWPTDKSLIFVEKYHLDTKTQWLYEKAIDYGVTPKVNILSPASFGGGVELDWMRILRQKENLPDGIFKSWLDYSRDSHFFAGTKIGAERILETNLHTDVVVEYQNRPEEDFYGIGPNSSAGEGTSYKQEETIIKPTVGYNWTPAISTDVYFSYRNINITNGEDGGRGEIDQTFAPRQIPGLAGDELLTYGSRLAWDTRNRKENSTQGGLRSAEVSLNQGIAGSKARYAKYATELSQYWTVGSERRVIAARFYGEHNAEVGDHNNIPFHQLAKLGGYGAYPRLSKTLRGYDDNRFFDQSAALLNLEYRYNIWEYREFQMDAVAFGDLGQVFGRFSQFKFNNFKESYGGGARLNLAGVTLLSVEIAHGDEGTNLYVRTSAPF